MRRKFLYAKDCSKKIRAVKKAQAERGERVATKPPYGYVKNPDNPKQIVQDFESAEVVRYIFKLCSEGRGPKQIARKLKEDQILTPSNYYYKQNGVALTNLDTTRPYNWSGNSVSNILVDMTYIGHTVNMKHTTVSYKNKRQIVRPESEWLVFKNTHEALITQELWDIVQSIRKHKKRPPKKMDTPNMFSGLVFCEDCGGTLVLHRAHTMESTKNNFMCSTYKKRVTHFARQQEKLFAEHINQRNSFETRKELTRLQRELDNMKRRDSELTILFKRLYEDNVLGRIPDEHFRMLSTEYTNEQKILRINIPKAEEKMEILKNSLTNVELFIEKAKRYTDITEVTSELLHLFIDRIVVGEKAERYSRTAEQCVWIFYRDIGILDDITKENDITEPDYEFVVDGSGELRLVI